MLFCSYLIVLCFRPWPWLRLCGQKWCQSLEIDVFRARLHQNEVRNDVIQFWVSLTSSLPSSPSCFFPSLNFRASMYGFHPPWWCPTSNPHCLLPEMPVLSIFLNISSKLSTHYLSMSISFSMVGTPVSCTKGVSCVDFLTCGWLVSPPWMPTLFFSHPCM